MLGNKKVIEPDLGQLVVYKPRAMPSVYKQLIDFGRFNNLYIYTYIILIILYMFHHKQMVIKPLKNTNNILERWPQ